MIIIVQCVIITTMLHTCAGLTRQAANNQDQQGQWSPQICVYCGSIEHSSSNCNRRPWDNREQPCGTPESLRKDQQANSEIWEMPWVEQPLWVPTHRDTCLSPNLKGPMLECQQILDTITDLHNTTEITIIITGSHRGSLTQGLMKDTTRGTAPPVFPPTPSLNSSFPEALSKSLLQIAENQSRTIEAMKASQEAQAVAYKEMTKTNKMRDDDALFHSIEVYDGSNPTKFEKWIDSIDQATHITGRDLRRVAEEIRWCHQKYTIDDG